MLWTLVDVILRTILWKKFSPESFIYIGQGYATDGYKLFKEGKEVNNITIK